MTAVFVTTDASGQSAPFTPGSDWLAQIEFDGSTSEQAVVYVQVRVDASAPWVTIKTIPKSAAPPFARFSDVPFARYIWEGNTPGKSLKGWRG